MMEILALIILNIFTYLIILLLGNQTPFAAPSQSFAKTLCSSCMMVISSKDLLSLPSLPHFVDTTLTAYIWHTFLLPWWSFASLSSFGIQYHSLSFLWVYFLCGYLFFCVCVCARLSCAGTSFLLSGSNSTLWCLLLECPLHQSSGVGPISGLLTSFLECLLSSYSVQALIIL